MSQKRAGVKRPLSSISQTGDIPSCDAPAEQKIHREVATSADSACGIQKWLDLPATRPSLGGLGSSGVLEFFQALWGASRFEEVRNALLRAPAQTTLRVNFSLSNSGGAYGPDGVLKKDETRSHLDQTLSHFHQRLGAQGRALPHCAWHRSLPDVLVVPSAPALPVSSLMSRATRVVVVDRLCAEAVLSGADIFAVGVVGCSSKLSPGDSVVVCADLDVKLPRGTDLDILFSSASNRLIKLGFGVARMSRSEILGSPTPRGVAVEVWERFQADAPPMNSVVSGLGVLYFLQTVPSMAACHALDPQPGEKVLDMCSAPGGKSTHIASLMRLKGQVVALDRSRNKVGRIKRLVMRLGYDSCVEAFCANSTTLALLDRRAEHQAAADIATQITSSWEDKSRSPHVTVATLKGIEREAFDRVLLDPPCSALGQRPRLFNDISLDRLVRFADYQRAFFGKAVALLKPGGVLVYSTCTISPLENESMVAQALQKHPCLRLETLPPAVAALGSPGLPGNSESMRNALRVLEKGTTAESGAAKAKPEFWPGLTEEQAGMVRRFDPDGPDDSIGFFMARFRKAPW